MFNVCYNCGLYRADKLIDSGGPYAVCPECGYKHPFRQLPLFIVSGASGAGKSTLCQALTGMVTEAIPLDADILWREEFNRPDEGYHDFFETWLRLCKNISQSGRPVMLFGAGIGVPENMEPRIERRYFSTLHYLALVCDDALLADRLHRRPNWRASSHQAFIDSQLNLNRWFKTHANQTTLFITLVDTTNQSVQDTAKQTDSWLHERL